MNADQKYGEGAKYATPNEQTVVESGQTADSTTQSVAEAGQMDPLTESTAQAATEQPTTADSAPAGPTLPISPQLVRGDEEPLLVPLTSYLSKVTASRANVLAFRELLHTVFVHYATSPEFLHRNHVAGIDEISILKSFYSGIAVFVERTADHRLGSRPPQDPGPLPGEAEQPDPIIDPAAYVSYGGDVLIVTDVATLQGWVTMLQTQNEVTAIRLEKEAQAFRGEIEELRSKLELERDRLLIANRKIAELESRPAPVATPPARKIDYSVSLRLDLGYLSQRTAEVKLVQYALQEAYTDTQVRGFNAIAEGEYYNAFTEFKDAEVIAGMLNELSESLVDVALHNLQAGKVSSEREPSYDADFEAFMTKYLPGISA